MIYVKIHKGQENSVVAVCDKNLIGKKISEGKLCLNIKEDFYKGKIVDEEELKKILKSASNLNIVGKEAIDFSLKEKIIDKNSIVKIKEVPHAQVYSI